MSPQSPPLERTGLAAQLWRALFAEAAPGDLTEGEAVAVLASFMDPLALDGFYAAHLPVEPPRLERASPPSPARVRAVDLALRQMLQDCPLPGDLAAFLDALADEDDASQP